MTAPVIESRPATKERPVVVDLSAPGVYEGMVRLARIIEQHIRAMPLEAMERRADDEANDDNWLARGPTVWSGWEILKVLASAQREFVKIRARAGG